MPSQQTVSLIIPAYNEEIRLKPFLQSIVDFTSDYSTISEILVVDDGSNDNTVAVAENFRDTLPITILKHAANQGKGAAVRTGVLAAKGDLIIFIDADGATPITELPKMIDALTRADIAVGNRWLPGAQTTRHSSLRRFSGWVYRTYLKLFGLGHLDTMCGFKGFRRSAAEQLFANLLEERWLFDTEIAYRAVQANYKIINIPINWESKDGSKLDTKTLLKSALQIWPLIHRLNKQSSKF